MGQSNMSILNKVGHSMFWSSMWDSKNSYNRYSKEDIFLKSFFSLSFTDSLSVNAMSFKKNKIKLKKYTQLVDITNKNLYRYYINLNKLSYYPSKIWILRYQKWLLIYSFIFLDKFNKISVKNFAFDDDVIFKNNFYYFYRNFLKLEKKNKNLYIKNKKPIYI